MKIDCQKLNPALVAAFLKFNQQSIDILSLKKAVKYKYFFL